MIFHNRFLANIRSSILVLLFAAVPGAILSMSPLALRLEEDWALPLLFHVRGPIVPPAEVVLVPIDSSTAENIFLPRDNVKAFRCEDILIGVGKSTHEHLPTPRLMSRWPRCLHAKAIDRLVSKKPKVILLDILFRRRSTIAVHEESQDLYLARVAADAGNVIVVTSIDARDGTSAELSPVLSSSVRAVAPSVLPQPQGHHHLTFLTFVDDFSNVATAPTLALDLMASQVLGSLSAIVSSSSTTSISERNLAWALVQPLSTQASMLRTLLQNGDRPTDYDKAISELKVVDESDRQMLRSVISMHREAALHYFNFYGPPWSFETIRYESLLNPEATLPNLQGKAVLVGFSESKMPEQVEHFATPFRTRQGVDLSGVELLATQLSNLMTGSALSPPGPSVRAAIGILMCLLVVALSSAMPPLAALAAALCLVLLYGVTAVYFFHRDVWLPLVVPLAVQVPIGLAAGGVTRYVDIRRHRDVLHTLVSKLVPEAVVRRYAAGSQQAGQTHEECLAACVFTDGEQYTALSESMSPGELARFLNSYYNPIFRPVENRGGVISDVVGDGVLAVWKDVDREARVRRQVCEACLDLLTTIDVFNSEAGESKLPTRIGVNYGEVSIGFVGTSTHLEYRAVGDTVNTAQRIQELNKILGTRLLVSDTLLNGLTGYVARDLGQHRFRGKTAFVRVFELVQREALATPGQRRLCEEFSEALKMWSTAGKAIALGEFRRLHLKYPSDGPIAFFARELSSSTEVRIRLLP